MRGLRHFLSACALAVLAGALPAEVTWRDILRQPDAWYASAAARAVADSVMLYQQADGGWAKNRDMTQPPTAGGDRAETPEQTIDNGATTTQLRLLARVHTAQPRPETRRALERGIDYLLAAQYENGGWPQFYPLRRGYYTHITFNDDAMVNVLNVLRDVAEEKPPFAGIDAERRARAGRAVEKGIACILRCQIVQDGVKTGWCAQHDEHTFAPAPARKFEPASLSGSETVRIVIFLMSLEKPSAEVQAAIEGAVAWLQRVKVSGLRVERAKAADGKTDVRAIADPQASPLWARFYELGTNRPIFVGRDEVVRYDFNEIERERRVGYGYLGTWPAQLLERDYPRWRAKHSR